MLRIFEFKARCNDLKKAEEAIQQFKPRFVGLDHQTDTYFKVPNGRLKLREGNIENSLIHYYRGNISGAKESNVLLYKHQPHPSLKKILTEALGIKVIVSKQRNIYFIENVKLHFDRISELGEFLEVEAIDEDGTHDIEKLKEQCRVYAALFNVQEVDYVPVSYSDLILEKTTRTI